MICVICVPIITGKLSFMKQSIRTSIILLLLAFGVGIQVSAQRRNTLYNKYIKEYAPMAVEQMKKYQIPASITLAQGLLESGAGRSVLARKSNNHFGIKCHGWRGRKVYHDDDAKGECFRAYKKVEDSYEDHSKFLKNGSRYAN